MNVYDIAIVALIAVLLAAAIAYIIKNRGKGGCDGCSGCGNSECGKCEYGRENESESCNGKCCKNENNCNAMQNNDDENKKS